jgi:Protein of unknown function, DUF547
MTTNIPTPAFVALFALATLLAAPAKANDVTRIFSAHSAGGGARVDHRAWSALLRKYVVPGSDGVNRVDYRAWQKAGQAQLKEYLARLQATDPRTLDRPEQFAYWANLYNAKTIDIVLAHYPVESIREISIDQGLLGFLKQSVGAGGPWKAKVLNVVGVDLSLDDIEHSILRPVFKDPRVHYAVNCASFGCPNLGTQAFTGADLEAQLEAGARAYVNHPRAIALESGSVAASSIYKWFQTDFGGSETAVLNHVRKYARKDLKSKLANKTAIGGYRYDWSLNDIQRGS